MMTDRMADSHEEIDRAVAILRRGGLVAFATETVYGLGADATRTDAVERIYRAKGRPGTNPLIVHIADVKAARRYARQWPQAAEKLARRFWPGPLTLVVPKASSIVDAATAGLDSVGLRAPNHPLALELLRRFDGAIAAPSANLSNRVSPTTAEHVWRELGDAVDQILDGGPCQIGIESTVLSLVGEPTILRPGGISQAQIESVIGPVKLAGKTVDASQVAASPGQQPVHYSPTTPTFRFESEDRHKIAISSRDIVLAMMLGVRQNIAMPVDAIEYARRLYAALHEADAGGFDRILIELPPNAPEWLAVRDRIYRAARPI
jgi:L-threonylcarbamoyladenylate synthase